MNTIVTSAAPSSPLPESALRQHIDGHVSLARKPQPVHPPTLREVFSRVLGQLEPRKVRIMEALRADQRAISRDRLAERAGRGDSSSSYERDLGNLRTLGLITYPADGMVELADWLKGGG